jgi:putative heme-binding domain-containing protein
MSKRLGLGMVLCAVVLAVVGGAEDRGKGEGPKLVEGQEGAKGLEDALRNLKAQMAPGDPLPPSEALKKFKVADGLAVDLVACEPAVKQPVYVTFDERGRLWVVQYNQYPFPAGLKIVEYDQYIRAKYDKVPPPPPDHFRGHDRITVHEDTRGDGTFDRMKVFLDGLNITTAVLPGRGGVWVLNPPYLLFYPDPQRKDEAAAKPEVHLSGFGLEDTHAVANSLTWGPDGWIYGGHGSTCTARVKVEITGDARTTDFLGQAIWRYHPETHRFEVFAEGGGNTFGVEFDDKGRLYSGTNWGGKRGLEFVQGGYYVKAWGKHGPLTNPYAFGYLDHMPHSGNGDRFTHNFVVYAGGALPEAFNGKLIAANPLQRRVQAARLEPLGSTFQTAEEPFLLTTTDGWFRPIDVKVGPDGAVYVTDFYEARITHLDPRDTWDRSNGRIYRVRPQEYKPVAPFDLAKRSSKELVGLLEHPNRWYRRTALRLLGDRRDRSVLPLLRANLMKHEGQLALESLWALHLSGGFDEAATLDALGHEDPHVRLWAVRLSGDDRKASPEVLKRMAELAAREAHAEVRRQLAASAKRLPGPNSLAIVLALLKHKEDANDPHIPLLLWWALEARAETEREAIPGLFRDPELWKQPLAERFVLERLVQRYAMAGGAENHAACARLLRLAPGAEQADRVLAGLEKAFAGKDARLSDDLKEAVTRAWAAGGSAGLILGVRMRHAESVDRALRLASDEKTDPARHLDLIRAFGEVNEPRCVPVLLKAVRESVSGPVRREALTALQRYDDAQVVAGVLELYPDRLPEKDGVRAAAHSLFASRAAWSLRLLQAIDAGKVSPRALPLDVVRTVKLHPNKEIAKLVEKHWGKVRDGTPAEKQKEMARLAGLLRAGKGDVTGGKAVFGNVCARCHKLFGEGGIVGPDLTGYERDNAVYWLENIVDPSAVIREEYTTFVVSTTDGRVLTGVIAEQDKLTVSLRNPEGQVVRIARDRIEEMHASPQSLMPEDLLHDLKEQQVRDLFAYLMSKDGKGK